MKDLSIFLWFDDRAEEAAEFYVSLMDDSRIMRTVLYQEGVPNSVPGTVMSVEFMLKGTRFVALNGGPVYAFNPAISIVANCETQDEVDRLWEALTDGGAEVQCGWLVDRFGVSWQVVPVQLGEYIGGPDREGSQRALTAMLAMKKLDIAALKAAYEGV
jgi:predicted 3-demethylubiquinone-9 3-methyltransferase (glyoxalase superfamily)